MQAAAARCGHGPSGTPAAPRGGGWALGLAAAGAKEQQLSND
jgi:hypothetical protein